MPITLLAGIVLTSSSLASGPYPNYPLLRWRLHDEFVDIGDSQGQSQPASSRNEEIGQIRWGDSTIQLGFYIGMLATEYALLADPDMHPEMSRGVGDINDTVEELGFALTALERLDAVADASFEVPCSQTEEINGFFIRDDVPSDAWEAYPSMTSMSSDYVDPILTHKEMSQDQVYHLLSGLALVRKLLPETVEHDGEVLRDWATEMALEIIGHVSKEDDWSIRNPACEDREVARGQDASGYALATSRAAAWFSEGDLVLEYPEYSEILAETGRDPNAVFYIDADNLHMAMAVTATGDGWNETTTDDLIALSAVHGWVLYPLLHQALHGPTQAWCEGGQPVLEDAAAMLAELPYGEAPYSPYPDTATHHWTAWNRFIRGTDYQGTGVEGTLNMEFAAVDFMLLHNLLMLTTPGAWEGVLEPVCPAEEDTGDTNSTAPTEGCRCAAGGGTAGLALLPLLLALYRRQGD